MLSGDMIKEHVEVGIQFNIPFQKIQLTLLIDFFQEVPSLKCPNKFVLKFGVALELSTQLKRQYYTLKILRKCHI